MTELSAVVLAAGEGRRLRPLTNKRPKPMLPAANRPILEYVFDALLEAGVTSITVVVGYQRERVQSHFGPTYRNVPIEYVIQEKQLGSGHALLAAKAQIEGPTVVVNGDQLIDPELIDAVTTAHTEADVTLGLIRHPDVGEYGGVRCEDDGTVTEIVEKPRDDRNYLLNAGVYAFNPRAFDIIHETKTFGEHSLIDSLHDLLEADYEIQGVISEGYWIDATYPWDLLELAEQCLDTEIEVAASAHVHDSATLVGPVIVDDDCVIGPGAVVGPQTCLGENVTVEATACVEHSVIDSDTRIGAGTILRDCVTGRGVTLGPGSTVVGGTADVRAGTAIHEGVTLGAVLADHVTDEGGVTYAPGTVVGPDAHIHAGATIDGTIEANTEVRS